MKLSEAQEELAEAYEKTSWTLEWKYYINPKQQHCFWHGGEYAVASRNYCGHEWEFSFGVYGDVIINAVWKPEELCDYLDENYIEEV